MKIDILSSDSFSVRSMATLVKTKEFSILIDPGIALGIGRYGLDPTPLEIKAFENGRLKIIKAAKEVENFAITHFHFDHMPFFNDAEFYKIFQNKRVFIKNFEKNINFSQKKRGYVCNKILSNLTKEIIMADSKRFDNLEFSKPVWHGNKNSKLGYVLMTAIYDQKTFVHGSDIQMLNEDALQELVRFDPDIVFMSGPPTYLKKIDFSFCEKFMNELVNKTRVKTAIIDHHLLRDMNYQEFFEKFKNIGVKILTAAEFIGKENLLLEARRKDFFQKNQSKDFKN
ncbi:MAG: hypothetical protein QXD62_00340 [Candidatus Woesearchaeota archaeon]